MIKYLLSEKELDKQMAKFWEMEESAEQEQLSMEELACGDHFQIRTCRVIQIDAT